MVAAPDLHSLGIFAANFTDPAHERTIYLAAGGLLLLGLVLLVGTIVWWRGTRGEHSALAPLELMGQRSWARAPYAERVRRLEKVRVRSDGDPVEPSSNRSEEIDLDELLRSFQPGFDDLRDEPVPVLVDAVPESQTVVRTADLAAGVVDLSPSSVPSVPSVSSVSSVSGAEHAAPSLADPADAAVEIAMAGDVIVDAAGGDPLDLLDTAVPGAVATSAGADDDRAGAKAETAESADEHTNRATDDERANEDDAARGLAVGAAVRSSPRVDPLLAGGVNET